MFTLKDFLHLSISPSRLFNTPMFTMLLDKSGNGFAASCTSLLITSFGSILAFVAHKLQNFELCECKSGRGGYSLFQVTGKCKWGYKLKPKKIPWTKMKPNHANPILNFGAYKSPERIVLFVCLLIYHIIEINFPRSISHSYKPPKTYFK